VSLETLLSVAEAARRLGGISIWTVRSWLSTGRLQRTKVGGRTMVAESELERFILSSNKTKNVDNDPVQAASGPNESK
jgi:excisionase family DNA binding protein